MLQTRAPKRRWESRCVEGWDSWTPDRIREIQEEKLRRFLTGQVYPFHPHYRRLFDESGVDPMSVRTVADLQRLPFTCKEDIAPSGADPENPRRFVLEPGFSSVKLRRPGGWTPEFAGGWFRETGFGSEQEFREEYQPVVTMFTTGRTAEHTPFFSTLYDIARMREAGRRLASVISTMASEDTDLRGVAINNFPGFAHLAYWVALTGAEGSAFTMMSTGGGAATNERILNIIERVRPTLFMGLPGYTYDLFREAAADGRDLSSLEVVAMGGDRVSPAAREKIVYLLEEMGAVEPVVTSAFGCTEMKYAWGDCGDDEDRGYHTCPDMEIIEVVDPDTGQVLGEGETGELVVTNLDARGSVVIRYRTGDVLVGGYTMEPCPNCGRTMPRISGSITRRRADSEFELSKVKGNLVDLNAFSDVLDNNVDVLEWRVEITKRNEDPEDIDEVSIFICPTSVGEVAGLTERVAEGISTSLEFRPDRVTISSYDELAERPGAGERQAGNGVADLRPA